MSLNYAQRDALRAFSQTLRPPCTSDSASDSASDVLFQLLDVVVLDRCVEPANLEDELALQSDAEYAHFAGRKREWNSTTAVYLFGVDARGGSVCVAVHDFRPWFYVEVPQGTSADDVRAACGPRNAWRVSAITLEWRKRTYGWVPSANPGEVAVFRFARVDCITAASRKFLAALFRNGDAAGTFAHRSWDVSEDGIAVDAQFMAATRLRPSGWVRVVGSLSAATPKTARASACGIEMCVPAAQLVQEETLDSVAPLLVACFDIECISASLEFPVADRDPVAYIGITYWRADGAREWAPAGRIMLMHGGCEAVPGVLVLSFCSELALLLAFRDVIVLYSDPDLLTGYNITGFDIEYMSTRLRALLSLEALAVSRFHVMGRLLSHAAPVRTRRSSSAGMGDSDATLLQLPGRVLMDMNITIKSNMKARALSSFSLDNVARTFLPGQSGKIKLVSVGWTSRALTNVLAHPAAAALPETLQARLTAAATYAQCVLRAHEPKSTAVASPHRAEFERAEETIATTLRPIAKELVSVLEEERGAVDASFGGVVEELARAVAQDNNYIKLFVMHGMRDEDRAAIARYCTVDCDLPLALMHRLNLLNDVLLMSHVTYTLPSAICFGGQQVKVFNQIFRFAREAGYVLNRRHSGWDMSAEYQGATVLPPRVGYYDCPVATLDFSSLYPSIIQAHNLCPSTLVLDEEYRDLTNVQYGVYAIDGQTTTFVKADTARGILPRILANLVAARKEAKVAMDAAKAAGDAHRAALYDSRQLAIKVLSTQSVRSSVRSLCVLMFSICSYVFH